MNCNLVHVVVTMEIGATQNPRRTEDDRVEKILLNVCWNRRAFTAIIHFKSPDSDQASRRSSLKL
jgi:hypothetical protein